ISNLVSALFRSPFVTGTFLLRARSNSGLKSNRIDRGLGLRPFSLPLVPGGYWYSLGGQPGPTLYSVSSAPVFEAARPSEFCGPFLEFDLGVCGMIASCVMLLMKSGWTSREPEGARWECTRNVRPRSRMASH